MYGISFVCTCWVDVRGTLCNVDKRCDEIKMFNLSQNIKCYGGALSHSPEHTQVAGRSGRKAVEQTRGLVLRVFARQLVGNRYRLRLTPHASRLTRVSYVEHCCFAEVIVTLNNANN